MARDISHRAAFDSHGETYVRVLAQRDDEIGREAVAWLAERQVLRDEAASAKRDAREEETLSIARRALSIAEDANTIATRDLSAAVAQARWAKWAAILAVIAAAIATKDQILALIFSNP